MLKKRTNIVPIKPNPPRGRGGKSRVFIQRKKAELPKERIWFVRSGFFFAYTAASK
jgi:hypothetical protein